ncbi:hypothetical protein PAXINDRAFT_66377 [Paxillus involutus ATCC 200175]|nr:hypothetical protein PAXINDRAFT_66377 [Paxillus involutus ATCC 200175]
MNQITALHDEVQSTCILNQHPKSSCAPQIHLLDEWKVDNPKHFLRKLHVQPLVFDSIITMLSTHNIFHNNSNNPQLPAQIQLAIFLNAAGHYGNAATSQDIADWAGVSVGTVHNCYKRVMITILDHHDKFIHFDQEDPADIAEQERAKAYVEAKTCAEWKGGFLCVDGTPFNLFQKPGWHGEGFFNRKSNYSLSNQVCNNMLNSQILLT